MNVDDTFKHLTKEAAYQTQQDILAGKYAEADLLDLLVRLDRPMPEDEFQGFYEASVDSMVRVPTELKTLDTCGTGGDGLNTFNISTATAILLAALDVPVAKHGNRSASGKCGSADVLEALGVNIELEPEQAAACLERTGFCFLFAPRHHPGFRHAAAARKAFGKRTYFNFLGPLLNPASAPLRLVGTADDKMTQLLGNALVNTGVTKAWVVHGVTDNMDEVSPLGETSITEFVPGAPIHRFSCTPESVILNRAVVSEIAGGNARANADILRTTLGGTGTEAQKNAIALNAGAALVVTSRCSSLSEGVSIAKQALIDKVGLAKLEEVRLFTQYK